MTYIAYILAEILLQIFLASGIVCVILYIIDSIALDGVAENRGLPHAWFAWLPVLRLRLIGSVSDHYRVIARADTKKREGILTVLGALQAAAFIAFIVFEYLFLPVLFDCLENFYLYNSYIMAIVISFSVFCVLSIVTTIYYLLCLYDVYLSCKPGKAAAYLVISILLPFVKPFLLFACRKKNDGMPDGYRLKGVQDHWQPTDEDDYR